MIPARRDPTLIARITSSSPLPSVRAGSALLSVGPRLLVVGDDAHAVAWLDPASLSTSLVPLAGDGLALPKLRKPDFEAAAVSPDGSVWLFGSGSLSNRWQLVRLTGPDHAVVTTYDGTPLFSALADHLGVLPNIEGALFVGETLRLFHRETGARPDVLLDLAATVVHGGLARVRASLALEPAVVAGVPAHVTDAALHDGLAVYLAAAEDTADPVLDGAVVGAVLGVIEADSARWTVLLEPDGSPSARKAEGLVVDPGGRGGWLVTDADDPSLPAELCRFELDGLGSRPPSGASDTPKPGPPDLPRGVTPRAEGFGVFDTPGTS